MNKLKTYSCFFLAVIAILGCSDDTDQLPCLTCGWNSSKCGDSWYDESKQFCYGTVRVFDKCGWFTYDPLRQFCSGNSIYSKCDGIEYDVSTKFCSDNIVYSKCGGKEYDISILGCCGSVNSATYTLSTQRCGSGNVIETKCGTSSIYYNSSTQGCCGNATYTLSTQRCSYGNEIETKCGTSSWYNASNSNLRCQNSVIETKCGTSSWYDATNTSLRCQNSVVETKCGTSSWYDATNTNLRCQNSVIETKCGTSWYNASNSNLRCQNSVIETKCGTNSWYNSSTQFCYSNNTIYNKCGGTLANPTSEYDPSIKYCSNGTLKDYGSVAYYNKTYKTVEIGTQVWMAENLNYKTPGNNSRCYPTSGTTNTNDNDNANCNTYGRLYNWSTAMALLPKCNSILSTSDTDCKITTPKHRGICPTDWHIPSNADWNTLMKYVNPNCSDNSSCADAGTKLKATSGWNPSSGTPLGTDNYGFSALPGGFDGSDDYFYDAGYGGRWWSSSEYGNNSAYYRYMSYYDEGANWDYYVKSYLYSVRCLQD